MKNRTGLGVESRQVEAAGLHLQRVQVVGIELEALDCGFVGFAVAGIEKAFMSNVNVPGPELLAHETVNLQTF